MIDGLERVGRQPSPMPHLMSQGFCAFAGPILEFIHAGRGVFHRGSSSGLATTGDRYSEWLNLDQEPLFSAPCCTGIF